MISAVAICFHGANHALGNTHNAIRWSTALTGERAFFERARDGSATN